MVILRVVVLLNYFGRYYPHRWLAEHSFVLICICCLLLNGLTTWWNAWSILASSLFYTNQCTNKHPASHFHIDCCFLIFLAPKGKSFCALLVGLFSFLPLVNRFIEFKEVHNLWHLERACFGMKESVILCSYFSPILLWHCRLSQDLNRKNVACC